MVKEQKASREEYLQDAQKQLDQLVGMREIKEEIGQLVLEVQGRLHSTHASKSSYHMMFLGDAGTGKTEVARLVAKFLYGMGISRTEEFLEVDRSDLVGSHIGETEKRTKKIIAKAMGGVLFIDEAYALAGSGNDFGKEAIAVLIKAMEDNRDDLIVILAGYRADMQELLKMNEGLRSRIPYEFVFPAYSPAELAQITIRILRHQQFDCLDVLKEVKQAVLQIAQQKKIEGNGRWARNFAERIMKQHYIRMGKEQNPEEVGHLLPIDIENAKDQSYQRYQDQEVLEQIRTEALEELHKLVGLEGVKNEMERILHFVAMEKKRAALGLATSQTTMHMIFAGPPGTGKTTVARIVAKYLYGLGILPAMTFIETDRSGLVGQYVGETETKTANLIERADGGVLFIDEAYGLVGKGNDFGQQAINTLIKEMEDRRSSLIVILAGYEDEMQQLLATNPGFVSRVPYQLKFPDYSAEELIELALGQFESLSFTLTDAATQALKDYITETKEQGRVEGNGRWVRNQIDKIRLEQSHRLIKTNSSELTVIEEQDIRAIE